MIHPKVFDLYVADHEFEVTVLRFVPGRKEIPEDLSDVDVRLLMNLDDGDEKQNFLDVNDFVLEATGEQHPELIHFMNLLRSHEGWEALEEREEYSF